MSDTEGKITTIEDIKNIQASGKTVAQYLQEEFQKELVSTTTMNEQELEKEYQTCLDAILVAAVSKLNVKSQTVYGERIGIWNGGYSSRFGNNEEKAVMYAIPQMIARLFVNKQHKRLVEDLKAQGLEIRLAYEKSDISANDNDPGYANLPLDQFDDMPKHKSNDPLIFYINIIGR